MTLDEKVGQMTQADRSYLRAESDIRSYFLGSVLSGGGSSPADKTAPGWAEMYDRYQGIALQTRLRIPLVYGIDAVHGHNNVVGAVVFPHNIGLGCTRDAALVERVARATAEQVAATGIDWTFSPCLAVARDERWGRTYESFGETPELVSEMAVAAVRRRSWPAPSTTSRTGGRPADATRATPRWTRRRCGPSTCRAIAPRSRPAWGR
jgi:beta-glucosidase